MALPKEPRQKMINIMYLVLTALLALNVSAEILNAFKTVDRSLTNTNFAINHSTETILASLDEKRNDPTSKTKADIWFPKAQSVVSLTKEMNAYIDGLKKEILTAADFDPVKHKGDSSYKIDNLDIATRILVDGKKGEELRNRLQKYKNDVLAIDPQIGTEFKDGLQIDLSVPPTRDKGNKTWEQAYFHMVPTVAAITMLSKFQNDVKTSENKVVAYCHEQVGKVTVRFDTYAAVIGQSSNYLMPGQELEITAGVGAFSKAAAPQITINGAGASLDQDGKATMKIQGGGVGSHSVPVHIVYTDQEGKQQVIDKKIEYNVGQANASIALDKMNVLYAGIANQLSVAASGGGDDRISVTINNGGRLEKTGAGKYNAFVSGNGDVTITVLVDGKVAGASQFRVRNIPTPTATIGGYASNDNINAGAFKAQAGVGAYIKDFPLDLKYTVTSYSISTDDDGGDLVEANIQGATWGGNGDARNVLANIKPGKTVYVDNIKAVGEDKRSFKVPGLVYYIK